MARKRGRGMAACWYGIARTATVDRAAAWAEIDDGGSAKIVTGVTEIGEGILTVLAQIAAHEIGVKPEHVVIGDNDTARSPEAAHAGASRQTYMIGNVVALASREARKRLVEVMAEMWDAPAETIRTGNGEIWAENTNHRITMGEAVDLRQKSRRGAGRLRHFRHRHDRHRRCTVATAPAGRGRLMCSAVRLPKSKSIR